MITPIEILNFIKKIKAIDNNNPLYYEKCILEFIKLSEPPIIEIIFNESLSLYRARTNDTNIPFKLITEITNPKLQLIKEFGRCNRPLQSIFYCSEDIHTSYFELEEWWRDNIETFNNIDVTVGEWNLTKSIKLALIIDPKRRITTYDKMHGAQYDKLVSVMNDNEKKVYDLFYNFLSEIFSTSIKDNPNIYKLTSAFSNLIFLHTDYDGIIYPSVQYKRESFNVVLKNNVFDTGLAKLNRAITTTFQKTPIENGNFEFKEINSIETNRVDNEHNQLIW